MQGKVYIVKSYRECIHIGSAGAFAMLLFEGITFGISLSAFRWTDLDRRKVYVCILRYFTKQIVWGFIANAVILHGQRNK